MSGGSLQLRQYLSARRSGASLEEAANVHGIGIAEARLWDADEAKGLLGWVGEPADLIRSQTAGCAVTTEEPVLMSEEQPADALAEMAADTLRGDVRDAMLSWFKATEKPWSQMGEREQRDFAETCDRAARSLVKQACQIIAANERPVIVASLVEYREKEGVEAKLKLASTGANVAALHEACGREVLIVTSGYDEVCGEAAPAEIDADQPKFPGLGEEYDEAA